MTHTVFFFFIYVVLGWLSNSVAWQAPFLFNKRSSQQAAARAAWEEAAMNDNGVAASFLRSAEKMEALEIDTATGDLDAASFLDAVDELTPALQGLGAVFSLASKQVFGNVAKLRRHLKSTEELNGGRNYTLHMLVLAEVQGMHPPEPQQLLSHGQRSPPPQVQAEGPFSCGRWASVALAFTHDFCNRVSSDEYRHRPMSDCVADAYDNTLRPEHGPVLQGVSKGILRVVPASRSILVDKMGMDEDHSARVLQRWANAYARPRSAIERFYAQYQQN